LYYEGQGITQDFNQAEKWYRQAAERGNAEAQSKLGFLYYKGEGVPQHFGEAAYWSRKAAERGNINAQNNLARMYFQGEGVERDLVLSLAARRGDKNAIKARDKLFVFKLSPAQIAEGERLAREWLKKQRVVKKR
jgi:hypothetical protein